jgi:hypothetical protein
MELDTVSRIEHVWADSQGLYTLVRLCLNHSFGTTRGRYAGFTPNLGLVACDDSDTLQLVERLFRMMEDEFTDWRSRRLTSAFAGWRARCGAFGGSWQAGVSGLLVQTSHEAGGGPYALNRSFHSGVGGAC